MDDFTDPDFVCTHTGERRCGNQGMGDAAILGVCQKTDGGFLTESRVCRDACMLTRRERDVLLCMVDGKTDKQIATTLNLSRKTVQHHVRALLIKLKAKNRTQAVVQALLKGLIDMQSVAET